MLLRIRIKNFLSFYEETSFDMFPNLKRTTFLEHVYLQYDAPLLKQAVIYGANGSGKSNLLEAFIFIKKFATDKDFLKTVAIEKNKFRLIGKENKEPICISIEFTHCKHYYIYSIEINSNGVEKEELLLSSLGKGENDVVFSRSGTTFGYDKVHPKDDIISASKKLIKSNPLSSLLSLNNEFPIINTSKAESAFKWFSTNLEILSLNRKIPALIGMMSKSKELLDFANRIFSKIGLGIESLEIRTQKLSEILLTDDVETSRLREDISNRITNGTGISRMQNDKILFSIEEEDGEKVVKEFVFLQLGVNDYHGEMEIGTQSDGTVRLLNLIPALFDAIYKEKVICIDEIENSIHPSLMIALMEYFSKTKSKGQLIFTTHETKLLDQQKLMRPDEVWFTEKQHGYTHLYSLNDFKEHNTIKIENGYLEGRYGGIPFIGNIE